MECYAFLPIKRICLPQIVTFTVPVLYSSVYVSTRKYGALEKPSISDSYLHWFNSDLIVCSTVKSQKKWKSSVFTLMVHLHCIFSGFTVKLLWINQWVMSTVGRLNPGTIMGCAYNFTNTENIVTNMEISWLLMIGRVCVRLYQYHR